MYSTALSRHEWVSAHARKSTQTLNYAYITSIRLVRNPEPRCPRLVTVWLPKPTVQDFRRGVMHLLPAMEATALAQGAHGIREGVVNIMEKHLVPAVLSAQDQGHDVVQHGPGAARVLGQELVPRQALAGC